MSRLDKHAFGYGRPRRHEGCCLKILLVYRSMNAGNDIPLALMLKFTVSITSTNASFFLYFTSARRQLVAPVAWVVILDDSSYRFSLRTTASGEGEWTYGSYWCWHDTLSRNIWFEGVDFAVLGVPKVVDFYIQLVWVCVQQQPLRTINKLVYDHKVVLHRLLVNLSKVCLANVDETVAKFEHESSVRVGSVM